ncbi:hypothetical protein [Roseivivax isoporae]|uniref:hypothetical protein n=1 Tax=Roseivivax isoporae TaxID=591206 RepID=UPI0012EB30A5|nr:hypothetical protein [Roseivivax isoporae]
MTAPKYVDPDRSYFVLETPTGPKMRIKADLPVESRAFAGGLIIAIQALVGRLDQETDNHDWRIFLYRDIFRMIDDAPIAGTGTEEEKQLHEALAIITQAFGLGQPGVNM